MEEIIAGIGIGFDVVEQHTRCCCQLGQNRPTAKALRQARGLHPGLSHQLSGNLAMLLSVGGKGLGQQLWIAGSQVRQAGDPLLQQHLAALTADATHLAEMPHGGGLLIADASPAAQGALFAIAHQGRWRGLGKISCQALQALIELVLQAASQCQALPLQEPAFTGHHQTMGHCCLLVLRQQAPPKRQHHPRFPG